MFLMLGKQLVEYRSQRSHSVSLYKTAMNKIGPISTSCFCFAREYRQTNITPVHFYLTFINV